MKVMFAVFVVFIPILLHSVFSVYENNVVSVNEIEFELEPFVRVKTGASSNQTLQFIPSYTQQNNEHYIYYTSAGLDLELLIKPNNEFHKKCWQVIVTAEYKQALDILSLALNLNFTDPNLTDCFRGPKAISSKQNSDDINLYPYTDKAIEFFSPTSAFWIVGSNYAGCDGIEWIDNRCIKLYESSLHFARLYSPPTQYEKMIDYMPRNQGQTDTWSFLIFEEKPLLLEINRWPGDKKAAFAFNNDADMESTKRLQAAYYGSSDPASPYYLTKGLIANHIKVSNTVFGVNYPEMHAIWDSIYAYGNSIGYHTNSDLADTPAQISQALLNDLNHYKVRLWADHSLPNNPEDFGMQGGQTGSPYYILDIINQSDIDYVWLGDTPYTNTFNAFDDPWRLPHKLHYFQNLNKPVWFFGRTRMETWEYLNDYYPIDMVHNLTLENLDNLLANRGLCIAYTHFSFSNNYMRLGFFWIIENDEYVIREDFDDALSLLDFYQNQRGLWIDTVENIFDRMLAIEQVEIVKSEIAAVPGFYALTLRNNSDINLENFAFKYGEYRTTIPLFEANSDYLMLLNVNTGSTNSANPLPFRIYYKDQAVYITSKESHTIPALNVSIYNIKGQLVAQSQAANQSNYLMLPFNGKSSGVYFAKIQGLEMGTYIKSFVVLK